MIQAAGSGDVVKLSADMLFQTQGSCIVFEGKDDVTFDCDDHHIEGIYSSATSGILFNYTNKSSSNNVVKNCNVSKFQVGVWFYYGYNNTVINVNSEDNEYGVIIEGVSSNALINSTLRDNYYDQLLIASDNNTLKNVYISTDWDANDDGALYVFDSNYNYFENITIEKAPYAGFTIDNITQNTITGSSIENCEYGLYVESSDYNLIYDNYFSNANNVYVDEETMNYWNTTKREGINIIGGPYIGGNYWSDYAGQDTTGDKIGEEPYVIDSNNSDYLPLTFTTNTTPHSPPESAPPENQSDGEQINGIYMPATSSKTTKTWDVINNGRKVEFEINSTQIPITNVVFVLGEKATDAFLEIEKEGTKPPETSEPPGEVYGYITIYSDGISEKLVGNISINFKVERSWIEENNISPSSMTLMRFVSSEWKKLQTEMVGSSGGHYYYISESPGFSFFSITGKEIVCVPNSRRCSENHLQKCKSDGNAWETIETCEYGCDPEIHSCKKKVRICHPGEIRCYGNVLQKCTDGGYVWDELETCEYKCMDKKCVIVVEFDYNQFYILLAVSLIMVISLIVMKAKSSKHEVRIKND